MNDQEQPLAHSQPRSGESGPQLYAEHATNVQLAARLSAAEIDVFSSSDCPPIQTVVEDACVFHDLGKLHPENQQVLRSKTKIKSGLPVDHVDSGVAHLWNQSAHSAAILISAHHRPGLPNLSAMKIAPAPRDQLRSSRLEGLGMTPEERALFLKSTDMDVDGFVRRHIATVGPYEVTSRSIGSPLAMRFGLSCLVDADHSDTAKHESGESLPASPAPRWRERTEALRRYVEKQALSTYATSQRVEVRNAFFKECIDAGPYSICCCEGTVGVGKTTAVMAYLMAVAEIRKLRRIFVIAPYTAIINQTVKRLRESVAVDGEDPAEAIAAHHFNVEFATREAREFAQLWRAPIVVTTAVQFFETLAAASPERLRKLHELPGSGIFIDESHACLPAHLWPLAWKWVRQLSTHWGCSTVLASGTMVRFWAMPDVVQAAKSQTPISLPVLAEKTTELMKGSEFQRVAISRTTELLTPSRLIQKVCELHGPRLVVVNTTKSAAALAKEFRSDGRDVAHLSTLLCPNDRDRIIEKLEERLRPDNILHDHDWTLVATSCIEAGVDFSFRHGFRESWSAASLLQLSGRINRGGDYTDATLCSFKLQHDEIYRQHPACKSSSAVLDELFNENFFTEGFDPSVVATEAFRRELSRNGELSRELIESELEGDFPYVAGAFRIIEESGNLVVVDIDVLEDLANGRRVKSVALMRGSISLPSYLIQSLGLESLKQIPGAFELRDSYDANFLGAGNAILQARLAESGGFLGV